MDTPKTGTRAAIGAQPQQNANGATNGYANGAPTNGYPDAASNPRAAYLLPHHAETLTAIASDVQSERGYRSEVSPPILAQNGFCAKNGKAPKWVSECVPVLFIPVHNAAGEQNLVQIRPDNPRFKADGKPIKYETPPQFKICVDVHPRIRRDISNPAIDLWITEGVKKGDSAISRGLCCVALLGVWNWRGSNDAGGTTALPDWEQFAFKHKDGTARRVYIAFDSDVSRKPEVAAALRRFVAWLEFRGASVTVVYLPDGEGGEKTGLDDYFERGGTVETLLELANVGAEQKPEQTDAPKPKTLSPDEIRAAFKKAAGEVAAPCSLADVKKTFRRWILIEDDGAIEVTLGTVAANLMDGDAVWLMLVGGSSGGKTEIVNPLLGLPFVKEAAVLTESSLLSGSSKRDHAAGAKGGLLREVGPFGLLILKDFTSILSMNKDAKTATLGALREVYDGSWTRHVGSDGGQELQWKGKLAVMACCTEAIDEHHAVIGAMGERFAFYRLPHLTRKTMARRAVDLTGAETQMRDEMKSAVAGLFAGLDVPARPHDLSEAETERLISLADFASKCRSAVMRDVRSEIVLVPESEYPARIAKIFRRVFSGMLTVGVDRDRAWQILTKIAFDSMHKVRRQVIELFIESGGEALPTAKISLALGLPTATTRRALEDLTAHGALIRAKIESPNGKGGHQDAWRLSPWSVATLGEIGKNVSGQDGSQDGSEVVFGDSKSTHTPKSEFYSNESEFISINSPTPRQKESPKTTSGDESDSETDEAAGVDI